MGKPVRDTTTELFPSSRRGLRKDLLYLLGQRRSSDQRDRGPAGLCALVLLAFPTLAEKALILALLEIELESYELRSLLDALGDVGVLVCNGGA